MRSRSLIVFALVAACAAAPASAAECTRAKAEADRKLVLDFYNTVFMAKDVSKAPKFLAPGYIQHNPHVASGLDGFMKDFGEGWKQPMPPGYTRTILDSIADCDRVAIYVRQTWIDKTGAARSHLSFDMFHIEHGMIAEHWDADD
jgi:predicted SnoaL-like aldol condensation-catalyzing enzyme